jgi:DNA-binding response OmpR family regulator
MEELLARVRALIRRSAGHGASVLELGSLRLDARQMSVTRNGVPVTLSPLEYRLLAYLMHHKGRVVSGTELLEHLYGEEDARETNALEAVVTRLRKKLGPAAIESRRGFGYTIADGAA